MVCQGQGHGGLKFDFKVYLLYWDACNQMTGAEL